MEKERSHVTKKILNLTLEIIYLLTGEDYILVKTFGQLVTPSNRPRVVEGWSRIQSPISEPPPSSLTPESNKDKKILEVTQKIIDLLTGEEWEHLEGHRDLYKDAMMENRPPLTSPDGSRNRNTPERCPRPLYSRDSTQEHHEIPQTRPLYSRDSTQEHQEIPQEDQGDGLIVVKVEDKDSFFEGDESCKEEEIPPEISTDGQRIKNEMEKCPRKDMTSSSRGENPITSNLHPVLPSAELSSCPPTPGRSFPHPPPSATHHPDHRVCYGCGKGFTSKDTLTIYHRSYSGQKPCSICRKCFLLKLFLINEERTGTGEKPYWCPECGKCFSQKSNLTYHLRIHTGEKPYFCSQCGKCFSTNTHLLRHQKTHTGVKSYSCEECGKSFTESSTLVIHKRSHTGEKPFSCLECGKCFAESSALDKHNRTHTGVKPYSCSACGKCFTGHSALVYHKRIHSGEKPYSCSECGKCFTESSALGKHRRSHTGEKPYSCSECGKSFTTSSAVVNHKRIHTGEKPYSCLECGKCFTARSSLAYHKRTHKGEKPYSC